MTETVKYIKVKFKKKKRKQRASVDEALSLNDFKNMMKQDSYCRHNGAITQRSWKDE